MAGHRSTPLDVALLTRRTVVLIGDNQGVRLLLPARVTVGLIAASLAFATGVGSTDAARQPTFREREALTVALPEFLLRYPVGCVWLSMSVSNSGRYAKVEPRFLNATHAPCLQSRRTATCS
jgi:hypothetical protein